MKTDQFYTVKTLAEKLAIRPLTIYRLVGNGKLAAIRIGRRLRFETAAVDAFLDAVRVGPKGLKNGNQEGRKS